MAPASVHFDHCDPSPSIAGGSGAQSFAFAMPPRRGVIDRVRRWRTTSDALCRTPISTRSLDRASLGAPRTASIASPSRDTTCSTQNAFHRQVLPRERFRVPNLVGARHRCLGFATEDPASGLLSPPRCSRPERLDPTSAPGALRSWTRRATCRLSTSATQTAIREHFRRIVRTPRTALVVAHVRSCFSSHRLSTAERIAGGLASYGMANRVVTGQGPVLGRSAH